MRTKLFTPSKLTFLYLPFLIGFILVSIALFDKLLFETMFYSAIQAFSLIYLIILMPVAISKLLIKLSFFFHKFVKQPIEGMNFEVGIVFFLVCFFPLFDVLILDFRHPLLKPLVLELIPQLSVIFIILKLACIILVSFNRQSGYFLLLIYFSVFTTGFQITFISNYLNGKITTTTNFVFYILTAFISAYLLLKLVVKGKQKHFYPLCLNKNHL